MQITVNLTSDEERLLKARYKREGADFEADLENWVLNQVAKEKRNMEMTGATIAQIEAVATSKENERIRIKAEAEAEAKKKAQSPDK